MLSDQLSILNHSRGGRHAVCAHPKRRRPPLAGARYDARRGRDCTAGPASHYLPCNHLQASVTVL